MDSSGSLRCWGSNGYGQLGNASYTPIASSPVLIPVWGTAAISAGFGHTCRRGSSGGVDCWGLNNYGQVGNNGSSNVWWPAGLTITDATSVSAGGFHTCAARSSGAVLCWGSNSYGQLGTGTTSDVLTPMTVNGLADVTAVSAGGSGYTCALRTDGSVQCWGSNNYGQLGNGSTSNAMSPMTVSNLSGVTEISAGGNHTCALRAGGEVQCWGSNAHGQLGNLSMASSPIPVSVMGL